MAKKPKSMTMRSVNPRQRNFFGGESEAYRIKKIHPPPDPKMNILGPEEREFWDEVYRNAYEYYSSNRAPDSKNVAQRTAWKAVLARDGLQNIWNGSRAELVPLKIPKPVSNDKFKKTVDLGVILEYTWVEIETGTFMIARWPDANPPKLKWHIKSKTLIVAPNAVDDHTCRTIDADMAEEAAMFNTWAQRPPRCQSEIRVKVETAYPVGVSDSIVYISDKWHSPNPDPYMKESQDYFHQNSDGTWVFQDNLDDPDLVLMHGGMLDVESRGIIH